MPGAEFGLSADDVRVLKQSISYLSQLRVNNPNFFETDFKDHNHRGIYVAVPPSGGIPALSQAGASPAEGDVAGSATCDIYQIDHESGALTAIAHEEKVFNLGTNSIQQKWIAVHQDKFGAWIASGSGGVAGSGLEYIEGVLGTNLVAAPAAADSPSTANLLVYEYDTSTGEYFATGEVVTVTNRFTEITTISAGTWMVCIRAPLSHEWRPIAADCGVTDVWLGTGTGTTQP